VCPICRQSEAPPSFLSALQAEVSEEAALEPVNEFSLEEANFSGCQLPELNFSASEEEQKKEEDGLFTLAFISELAKKLDVGETTQWHDAQEEVAAAKKQQRISDVSLLSDEMLNQSQGEEHDDKNDTKELLNDTIERMERLLGMGVDYLDQQDEPQKVVLFKKKLETN
jgi:hypothetical protein